MRKYWLSAGLALFLAVPAAAQAPSAPPMPNPNVPPTQAPGIGARSIYAAATVNEFLSDCHNDQSGCMNEIGNAFLKHMNDTDDTICLTSVNYGTRVPNWLASHAETGGMPAEDGIYLALQKLYPCNSN